MTNQPSQLSTYQAVCMLAHFGPRPDRPVQPIALYAAGKRYGGFTSEQHAHEVARILGYENYRIAAR